jgi:hypothetical protein
MAKTSCEITTKQAQAIGLVFEQNARSDWGATQHLNMLAYLVLACSNAQSASIGDYKFPDGTTRKALLLNGKPVEKIEVDWKTLRNELQTGLGSKLAECANCKKRLADEDDYAHLKADSPKSQYV